MTPVSPTSFFLLRGLARESRHWGDFIRILEEGGRSFRVFALEIPGTGRLRKTRSPVAVSDYVSQLRSQYQQYRQKEYRNIVLGLSFGGMIAASWMDLFPEDFQAAVLINTSCRTSPPYRRLKASALPQLFAAAGAGSAVRREKHITNLVCNLADKEIIAAEWGEIARDAPVSGRNALRQLQAATRFNLPSKPAIPVLLLNSVKDRLVSARCSATIARLWQAECVRHPTAGHDLPTDDPHWCVEKIAIWLQGIYSQPSPSK